MITEDERFIEIQGILANSDISTINCAKINDLIIELSKEKKQLQQENQELNGQLKKQKGVIDKAIDKLNIFIKCCKAAKIESDSDYFHYQYWDMFERFNKKVKQILEDKEV